TTLFRSHAGSGRAWGLARTTFSVFHCAHGGGVETAVDVKDFTTDARGEVGAQECAGITDFLDGDVAAQRGLLLVGGQHLAEAGDTAGGQGANRAGGDGVDAGAFRAEAAGQVTYTGFQAGLGHAHHVVVGHGALGTQVGEGEQAAVAAFHHLATRLGQGDETVGADVVGDLEAFTGGDFGEVAIELVARGETDRVDDTVQAVPFLAQRFEYGGDFLIAGHVAGEAQVGAGAPAGGEVFHAALELLVLVGESQLGTFAVHGSGDTRGDGQFAGNANDEYALTG